MVQRTYKPGPLTKKDKARFREYQERWGLTNSRGEFDGLPYHQGINHVLDRNEELEAQAKAAPKLPAVRQILLFFAVVALVAAIYFGMTAG